MRLFKISFLFDQRRTGARYRLTGAPKTVAIQGGEYEISRIYFSANWDCWSFTERACFRLG
jgi:hypothetical protein